MHRPFAALALVVALAACHDRGADANTADTAAVTGDNAADLTPEKAGIFDRLFNNGQPLKLAIEQNHPNGGVLKLNSIQVKPTETVLNITYVNGHTSDVQLNWATKKTYLLAGDRKFFLSPPIANNDVRVTSGSTMTGDMVFMGAVPQVDGVRLIINENIGSNNEYTSIPGFDVPIPTPAAAFSNDGSKKN